MHCVVLKIGKLLLSDRTNDGEEWIEFGSIREREMNLLA